MFCILGGIFAFRWHSYSVAGRGVVKNTDIEQGAENIKVSYVNIDNYARVMRSDLVI